MLVVGAVVLVPVGVPEVGGTRSANIESMSVGFDMVKVMRR